MKKLLLTLLIILHTGITFAYEPEFSTAGFFSLEGTGRKVFSMNRHGDSIKEPLKVQKQKITMTTTGK